MEIRYLVIIFSKMYFSIFSSWNMDAIRKKMQSLKGETDVLYATIARYEGVTKEANSQSDQHEADIRDLGKKIQGYESDFDETNDKFIKAMTALEEKEKAFKTAEEEVRQFRLKAHVFLLKSLNHKIDAFRIFCTIFHKLLSLLAAVCSKDPNKCVWC